MINGSNPNLSIEEIRNCFNLCRANNPLQTPTSALQFFEAIQRINTPEYWGQMLQLYYPNTQNPNNETNEVLFKRLVANQPRGNNQRFAEDDQMIDILRTGWNGRGC